MKVPTLPPPWPGLAAEPVDDPLQLPNNPKSGDYKEIWRALAEHTQARIVVRCNPAHMETLIQAVKKIKSTENAARKRMDDEKLPHWGRLTVEKDAEIGTVKFGLTYSLQDIV